MKPSVAYQKVKSLSRTRGGVVLCGVLLPVG